MAVVILLFVVVVLGLAGCGGSAGDEDAPADRPAATQPATTEEQDDEGYGYP